MISLLDQTFKTLEYNFWKSRSKNPLKILVHKYLKSLLKKTDPKIFNIASGVSQKRFVHYFIVSLFQVREARRRDCWVRPFSNSLFMHYPLIFLIEAATFSVCFRLWAVCVWDVFVWEFCVWFFFFVFESFSSEIFVSLFTLWQFGW